MSKTIPQVHAINRARIAATLAKARAETEALGMPAPVVVPPYAGTFPAGGFVTTETDIALDGSRCGRGARRCHACGYGNLTGPGALACPMCDAEIAPRRRKPVDQQDCEMVACNADAEARQRVRRLSSVNVRTVLASLVTS